MDDAVERARDEGMRAMEIQGDPHAPAFYSRLCAVQIGTRASESIAGRHLPLFEIDLASHRFGVG